MNIQLAQKSDALAVAKIHKIEISQGFLSSLPLAFLEKLYLAMITFEGGVCVVAKENNQVIGFIAGTASVKSFYLFFLKKHSFQATCILFLKIFSISQLKKIFETLFYPARNHHLPEAELLTMAVTKGSQGKGIASQMFTEFVGHMKNRGVKEFKVLVGDQLQSAIRFYEKSGFVFLTDITIHDNKKTKVYGYTIV